MKRILVVANETVAGKPLIDAVKRRAAGEEAHVHVICPQNEPKHGYVVYDEHIRDAAENRLEMTLALLREAGIEATGEVMDPDPYSAVMDAARRAGLRRDRRLDPSRDALRLAAPGPRGPARARHPARRRARGRRPRHRARRRQADARGRQPDRRRPGPARRSEARRRPRSRGASSSSAPPPPATATPTAATPTSASPTRSAPSRTPASRRSGRSSTPTRTRRSRTRSSSTGPTTSSSRPSPRRARAGCAPT